MSLKSNVSRYLRDEEKNNRFRVVNFDVMAGADISRSDRFFMAKSGLLIICDHSAVKCDRIMQRICALNLYGYRITVICSLYCSHITVDANSSFINTLETRPYFLVARFSV